MQVNKVAQKAFTYVKPENSRVFIPLELEVAAYNKIANGANMLEQAAKVVDKDIKFAPKGKNVLMNFGPFTSLIDVELSENEVLSQMHDLIRKTYTTIDLKTQEKIKARSENVLFKNV